MLTILYTIIQFMVILIIAKLLTKNLFKISDKERKVYTNEVTHLKDKLFIDSFYKFYL